MSTSTGSEVSRADFAGLAGDIEGVTDSRAPLVLLHGLTYDRTTWRPVLEHLRRIDPERRVLALDLPGHGGTPARVTDRTDDVINGLHAAVRAAGLEAPVIVGHSMSGAMATFYGGSYPSRGVVNVDNPPNVAPFAAMLKQSETALRSGAFMNIWQSMEATLGIELLEPEVQLLVRASSRPDQAMQLGYWQQLIDTPEAELDAFVVRSMAAVRVARIPYLLIMGSKVDADSRALLDAQLPGAVVREYPGSGHFVHLRRAEEFAQVLVQTGAWRVGGGVA